MQSVTSNAPVGVVKVVTRTLVSSRYWRADWKGPSGPTRKVPPRCTSRMRQNTAGESNRGKHAQSMEPSRPTSAAEWQSPSKA
ncbi:MAG TPA: hypothetical protein VD972_05340 [Hyalangium sp.]|nr:hypothetical protein [Hyalangium sp.]HYH95376.1 hypothetical protein [Hyalangium sp.]